MYVPLNNSYENLCTAGLRRYTWCPSFVYMCAPVYRVSSHEIWSKSFGEMEAMKFEWEPIRFFIGAYEIYEIYLHFNKKYNLSDIVTIDNNVINNNKS